ncbi:MAG: peptidoglycan DD-metalloendopeptidase family protein [Cyclobacteriaceae bacterium]
MNNTVEALQNWLLSQQKYLYPLLPGLSPGQLMNLDLSENNAALKQIDLTDTQAFHTFIFGQVLNGKTGIGGFFENRSIYRRSAHFDGTEARSLHLGLDIWTEAGTPLFAPLDGVVHSLADNQRFGNYGPTLILKHQSPKGKFYSLYGHLMGDVLDIWQAGDSLSAGTQLARIGNFPENGHWPPHLHWQVMTDMLGFEGDFPGVAEPSREQFYRQYCVDPSLLLRLDEA